MLNILEGVNMKLYFTHLSDLAHTKQTIIEQMKEEVIKELEATEAKRVTGSPYFFCTEYMELGEVRGSCGKICDAYKPNNGKNGRCKHYGWCYEETETKILIKV